MIHKLALTLVTAVFLYTPASAKSFKDMFPMLYSGIEPEYKAGLDAMDLQEGVVEVQGGIATFDLPEGYYFLGPKDARFVLETLWENPESVGTLGMIFPKNTSPFHTGSWAIEVTFDNIGYVSDDDADSYDYGELLAEMQADARADSDWRAQNGYQKIELLGWAAEPHYDKAERKLYWAKRLQFEGEEGETLNYNIRALGRRGVLVLNFIADMRELEMVESAAPDVLKMVNFSEGHRYSDFVPGVDTVAAVGIGGLIAGKVLAKTGFLVVALLFLKKFAFILIIPVVWAFGWISRRLRGGR